MLLVYTHKITPRLTYIFKHYFIRILNIPIQFSTKVEEFVAHNGPKITYGKMPLGNEFFVESNTLLFEQGISELIIKVENWDNVPCFFKVSDKSKIPFDIFAAAFYLISRYEEYVPHVKDETGCFSSQSSLAVKHQFIEKPVVDIWAYKLLAFLTKQFPDYNFTKRKFEFIPTINVQRAYLYKHKGLARFFGEIIFNIVKFRFRTSIQQLITILGFKKDPYNTFEHIINLKKEYHIDKIFFFCVGNYSVHDRNSSFRNTHFRSLIKSVADYAKVGLLASYFTMNNEQRCQKEKERLEGIINVPIQRSRQHYLRVNLPETYQHLIDLEVEEEYSMSYKDCVGFRASTCTPFYFYDLDFEIQTPLKVFSPTISDTVLKNKMKLGNVQCLKKIETLLDEVKKVDGTFVSLFHNHTLSETPEWKGWRIIYEKMLKNGIEKMKN